METDIHLEIASNDWIPACAGMDGVNTLWMHCAGLSRDCRVFATLAAINVKDQHKNGIFGAFDLPLGTQWAKFLNYGCERAAGLPKNLVDRRWRE